MHTSDDMRLLEEYAKGRSEEAFSALVSRNINLVYSAAMRSVNNPHQAEEITQAVFVTLARKSGELSKGTVLSGWLYQTARLTASNFIRSETRRQQREQQAHIQSTMNAPEPEPWTGVGPLLEEAMSQLNDRDRDAIVLRFFEGKPLKEVGDSLGTTEEAAQMRVSRALDKLREFFHRRGITVPAAALAAAIAENSIQAAPAGLAASVVSAAAGAVQETALTASTLGLVKGAIHIMTTAKIGVAIGACAAATIIALQWHRVSTQKQAVTQLEAQVAQVTQTSHTQQAEIAKLQERNASYAKSMESMSRDAAKSRANAGAARDARQLAAAAKKAAAGANGNPMAEMYKDPEMLKAMKGQVAMTVKAQYAPLVKQLQLSPEQADKFYQILVDKVSKQFEVMQSGKFNLDDIKSGAISQEASLKSLLGDAGYAQYNDFSENLGDQMMLTQVKNNFVDNPLSDTQEQQLLQAMKSARNNPVTKSAISPPDHSQAITPEAMAAVMEQTIQQQERVNQNVLQLSAAFLSPDQLQTLGTSLSNQIVYQKAGMNMAQKMFTNAAGNQ